MSAYQVARCNNYTSQHHRETKPEKEIKSLARSIKRDNIQLT